MTELRACIKRKCDVIIPSYSTARPNFRFAPGFKAVETAPTTRCSPGQLNLIDSSLRGRRAELALSCATEAASGAIRPIR